MPTEDRRIGKQLPSPVTPVSTVCFKIQIPNAVQYRAAFLGQINVLGQALTWDHPVDGTECLPCEEAAQLWRNAIYDAVWSDECEEPLNCDDVADCIDSDLAVQASLANAINTNEGIQEALAEQIANNPAIINNVYNTTVVGSPMTANQRGAGISSTTDCEPNALFGSVTAIVKQLHLNNQDFLEVFQLTDNAQQRLSKIVKAIPLLNEVPIDEALDFASQMAIEIKENYDAQWTTAIEDEYRCALFCLIKDRPGCVLSFQDMVVYWNDRLGTSLEPINFFQSVVQYFISGTWSGTTVVDIMMLIQLSAWQQASEWTGITLRSLQTVGALGANDPDEDWEILCEECAPEPVDLCEGGTYYDFRISNQGFTVPVANYSVYHGPETGNPGWGRGTFDIQRAGCQKNLAPLNITKVRIETNEQVGFVQANKFFTGSGGARGSSSAAVASGHGTWYYTINTSQPYTDGLYIWCGTNVTMSATARILSYCVNPTT